MIGTNVSPLLWTPTPRPPFMFTETAVPHYVPHRFNISSLNSVSRVSSSLSSLHRLFHHTACFVSVLNFPKTVSNVFVVLYLPDIAVHL